jgi:hypothetical protein
MCHAPNIEVLAISNIHYVTYRHDLASELNLLKTENAKPFKLVAVA